MKILKIKVSGQSVVWENPFDIVQGCREYLGCEFSFSEDWENVDKAVRFYQITDKKFYGFEDIDGVVTVPAEVIKGRAFYIAVGGYGDGGIFIPTSAVKIKLQPNGYGEPDEDVEEGEEYKSALDKLLNLAGECKDACDEMRYAPYINENGNWYLYNRETKEYEDSGIYARGLSAYEIAKTYGFEGTEEEWLESLKAEAVQVDDQMSDYSTNAVQNRVAKQYVDNLRDNLNSQIASSNGLADSAGQVASQAKTIAENAELIAKGRATGYVFDTVQAMLTWIGVEGNKAKLVVGDNLYIRELDVPDFWWDGNTYHPLETQKVNLTEYIKQSDVDTEISPTSTKPIQSRAVFLALNALENSLGSSAASANRKADSALDQIGDIDTALDAILAIQNELIGGDE